MEIFLSFLIIIFLLALLGRLLAPWLLRLFAKQMLRRYGQQSGAYFNPEQRQANRQKRSNGDITIEQFDIPQKIIGQDIGQYVDFEELD